MFWQLISDADLSACLAIKPSAIGQELVGYARTVAAWRHLLKRPSFCGFAVKAEQPIRGRYVVGFGGGAFVKRDFVEREVNNREPGVVARAIASIDAGFPVLLTEADIRRQNSTEGLDVLFLGGYVRADILTPTEAQEALNQIWLGCFSGFRGYRLRSALREAVDAEDVTYTKAMNVGSVVVLRDHRSKNPKSLWSADRALMISTREDGLRTPGSIPALLYDGFHEPILGLTPAQQQLLQTAEHGLTDEELARVMTLKLAAVKKRWASAFDRVARIRPGILWESGKEDDRSSRGPQKRHRLLAYVREHPEELRPWRRAPEGNS
jgi:hypothetical protein